MFDEGSTRQRFRCDVGKIVGCGDFNEEDAAGLFRIADYGEAVGDPSGFGGDALAPGTVNEDAGVSEHVGGRCRVKAEFAEKYAKSSDGFGASDGLEEFGST